ncbi:MAG TPA: DUF202 domain-containing protein [Streptosporangiaceae bacterium]|nr:DUF202 domain-containing protein [Streptosporangiaceae bacterium]
MAPPDDPPADEPPEDMEEMDPGLARERTELAWTRTSISFAALGAAALKEAPAPGALILAMSLLIFVLARRARPGRRAGGHDRRHPLLLLVTVAVTGISMIALALTLFAARGPLRPAHPTPPGTSSTSPWPTWCPNSPPRRPPTTRPSTASA